MNNVLIYLLGLMSIAGFIATAAAGFNCLRIMGEVDNCSNKTLYAGLYDALRMVCPFIEAEYPDGGQRFAVAHFGVAVISLCSLIMAGMDARHLLQVGCDSSNIEEFLTHLFFSIGIGALIYGAAYGAKRRAA